MIPAVLVLEDGRVFAGRRFGAMVESGGEVVFNTAMTGYQEVLGDPSYARQLVLMTYPMMGNYGIAPDDFESHRAQLSALIVKEPSRVASNWRHRHSLDATLRAQGVCGLSDIDTRALTRHLRRHGSLRGCIADAAEPQDGVLARCRALPPMAGTDLAAAVSCQAPYTWEAPSPLLAAAGRGPPPSRYDVVVLDFGVKRNILRRLVDSGCRVTVLPGRSSAAEVLARRPHGVVLSNGPGDPEPVTYGVTCVRGLIGRVPLFGICLGHQLLALAVGAKSFKLPFGHRGANHPVMDLTTRRVEITSQNHGFAIDPTSLDAAVARPTHVNLNDQTLEGIALQQEPAFSVQYHPEAAPGPHDAAYLFARFTAMMDAFAARPGAPQPGAPRQG